MLKINGDTYESILAHVRSSYPHECCGVLIGTSENGVKMASSIHLAGNLNTERAHDRYEMDPTDILKAEKLARLEKKSVLGFYHSHPDHPDAPSQFDRERAWPDYSYLIVAVAKGTDVSAKCWTFAIEGAPFSQEDFSVE